MEVAHWLENLAVAGDQAEAIKHSLAVIDDALSYWLDDSGEAYAAEARQVCEEVYRRADAIIQQLEFAEAGAVAWWVRWALCKHDASDSCLSAAYALTLAIMSLDQLCGWLISLRSESIALASDKTMSPCDNLERARWLLSREEIDARLWHSEYLAAARHALYEAELCAHAERLSSKADGYRATDLLRSAMEAATSSARGKAGGKGNSRPGSAKQQAAAENWDRIHRAAEATRTARPGITETELVSVLLAQGHGTRPTIRKHLAKPRPNVEN